MKKCYLILAIITPLALAAMSCNLPFKVVPVSNDPPQENFPAQERPPEEFHPQEGFPPEENRPPEEIPPEEIPPEEIHPPEQQPEGEPRGVIFGWDYIDSNMNDRHDPGEPSPGAGSTMPVYEGPCPSSKEVASAPVNGEGYYRIENLLPGTYCVGALRTVTLEPGQELEVSFPSPP
ncbi:MAG: hypothetical protein JW730_11090 [Anaerolineales bacterium]|nr:hypothetical protein [Anaerolineales bacterium]